MPTIEVSDDVMQWLEGHMAEFREIATYAAAHGTQFNSPRTVDEIADGYLRSLIPLDHVDDDDMPF